MHRLASKAEGSLHPDILSDSIHDASDNLRCSNWAAGLHKQYAVVSLGMASPFSDVCTEYLPVCNAMLA